MLLEMTILCYAFGCFWFWYVGAVKGGEFSDKENQNFIEAWDMDDETIGIQLLVS